MFKAVIRLLSTILLAVAVIMAVLDATRSIAVGSWVMTPVGVSWGAVSPQSLDRFQELVTSSLPMMVWDPLMLTLLRLPGFIVFTALSLLLALAGHKRKRHASRITA